MHLNISQNAGNVNTHRSRKKFRTAYIPVLPPSSKLYRGHPCLPCQNKVVADPLIGIQKSELGNLFLPACLAPIILSKIILPKTKMIIALQKKKTVKLGAGP